MDAEGDVAIHTPSAELREKCGVIGVYKPKCEFACVCVRARKCVCISMRAC